MSKIILIENPSGCNLAPIFLKKINKWALFSNYTAIRMLLTVTFPGCCQIELSYSDLPLEASIGKHANWERRSLYSTTNFYVFDNFQCIGTNLYKNQSFLKEMYLVEPCSPGPCSLNFKIRLFRVHVGK